MNELKKEAKKMPNIAQAKSNLIKMVNREVEILLKNIHHFVIEHGHQNVTTFKNQDCVIMTFTLEDEELALLLRKFEYFENKWPYTVELSWVYIFIEQSFSYKGALCRFPDHKDVEFWKENQ